MTNSNPPGQNRVRHILSLSGGKDSAALAVYMRDRGHDLEYVFCDTGDELPETYDYLERLEAYLGQSIVRLNPDRPFSHYLEVYGGVLPDARTRWCTRMLKIKPFERYIKDDPCINYIGIRADEDRTGYISSKKNLKACYPFIEDGITRDDVFSVLKESGLELPPYYRWRSRSGCYFCFFQRRIEWVGLLENHPDLFIRASEYEKLDSDVGRRFTWSQRESLGELADPKRVQQIKDEHQCRIAEQQLHREKKFLKDILDEEEDGSQACLICHL